MAFAISITTYSNNLRRGPQVHAQMQTEMSRGPPCLQMSPLQKSNRCSALPSATPHLSFCSSSAFPLARPRLKLLEYVVIEIAKAMSICHDFLEFLNKQKAVHFFCQDV